MNKKRVEDGQKSALFRCRGHIWIEGSEGTFLGYGRVALLEGIRDFGSITKAAQSLKISYRRAWIMINSMNRQAPVPYVETATGGKGGGGTRVTKEGEGAVRLFWKLHKEFQQFLSGREKHTLLLSTRKEEDSS